MPQLPPSWRPERAVPIADALHDLLDDLECLVEHGGVCLPADPLPFSTGLIALDKVSGGGLRAGTVTLLDTGLPAQGRSLLYAVARRTQVPTLLAACDLMSATRWLLAGASSVPAELIRSCQLSETDWRAIASAVAGLAASGLTVTEACSLKGLGHVLHQAPSQVVLVEELGRFGDATQAIIGLAHLAEATGAAILATIQVRDELPAWATEGVTRIAVVPHGLGSRAALVTTDHPDGLVAAQLQTACLVGEAS